ncbi:MAG: tetratricopeptide repeat protein [Elusimicrobia bacterium]|nr:tetratricopeptide repeat protein [Elusimicrobiota bacterium]
MITTLLLAFALLSASPGTAQDEKRPPESQPALTAETEATKAAPELARLDQVLTLAQEAKQQGRLAPERYEGFLKQFRGSLDTARAVTPPSPAASALYARILARLGEPQEALATLTPALEQDPDNPNLRVALGHVRYEEKDYPAAHAEAEAVLKRDPTNKEALALKYFSRGRTSGVSGAAGIAPSAALPASGLEEASILHNPRIVEAGRRALARQSAISLTDKAMGRLKIDDPREALRFLALAEAIDPGFADVPMQQGLAYRDLKQHATAVERFTQAEALWRAKATPRSVELAGLAGKLRESETAELNQNTKVVESPVSQPKNSSTPLPLLPVGLFTAGALTAFSIYRSRQTAVSEDGLNPEPQVPDDNAHRNWMTSAKVAGVAFIALATWEFGPGALAAGRVLLSTIGPSASPAIVPAVAGSGTGIGAATAITAEEAIKLGLPVAVGAYGAKRAAENLYSKASSNSSATQGGTSQGEPDRDRLLRRAQDPDLRDSIDNLYRKNAKIGSGSSMDAYRYEAKTGIKLSKSGHGEKLIARRDQLMRVLRKPGLSSVDKQITKDLLIDIQNALSGL